MNGKLKHYRIDFSIDVTALDPVSACRRGWEMLTAITSPLPVGHVLEASNAPDAFHDTVDLQEEDDKEHSE